MFNRIHTSAQSGSIFHCYVRWSRSAHWITNPPIHSHTRLLMNVQGTVLETNFPTPQVWCPCGLGALPKIGFLVGETYPAYRTHISQRHFSRPPAAPKTRSISKLKWSSSKDICGGCKWPKTCRHSRPQKRWFTIKEILVSAVTSDEGEGNLPWQIDEEQVANGCKWLLNACI